ncbi:MAG: 1-deoxy-D-xylulose-5-phosphate synthase [Candidatus Omnitrophica bacterium]|nr:1-deoxy-D-xylulose-5-phosphate synthase [Candidatus Omnitrophota bacterium]
MNKTSILDRIESPDDLRKLKPELLPDLARELRERILQVVHQCDGHLASSLGAIELNIALQYVFNTPEDQIVWDMGYQAYSHKLMTGRRDQFHTLRTYKGISGFSNPAESEYDLFNTGHGGACVSLGLGLAAARDAAGKKHEVISIIGDAAMGAGMAFEALNHAGHLNKNFILVLNDNTWSIAKSVGALSKYLTRVMSSSHYNKVRDEVGGLLKKLPRDYGDMAIAVGKKLEESMKGLLGPGMLFEELGFRYFGPIDGHNLPDLIRTFEKISKLEGPRLLHVITKKGKGYAPAENAPERFHKPGPFVLGTGEPAPAQTSGVGYTKYFTKRLLELGEKDKRIVTVCAAMPLGTGTDEFARRYPERFFDAGLAEQHAVAFAGGLAKGGYIPVVAIYSSFVQRAFDQIFHDVALQNSHVVLCLDRASLVGEDGPTHHGLFDISFTRCLPRTTLMSPRDGRELEEMLEFAAYKVEGPVVIRYPREDVPDPPVFEKGRTPIELGKAELLCRGEEIALVAFGNGNDLALEVFKTLEEEGHKPTLVNARFAKPVDEALMWELAQSHSVMVTFEEGVLDGGFGSAVMESIETSSVANGEGPRAKICRIGIPNKFYEHGDRQSLLEETGLTPAQALAKIRACLTGVQPGV